ncbi:hypothetical protein LTR64_000281 [Lithohypha guttulata]|uniref:uncharacterized protein n=1 Tax=Lithohypha guttulata TaxID=1690604 RepID=UPI002DE17D3B|nr:hypothetical protein LTR51_007642 [Lithohypha guttulata]
MPQLKQISCCVQWSDTNASFQEHGAVYGDGVVESFIIVPNKPQRFCLRLTSRGYIYEGLAMIIFIDGQYQCNRTRVNLLPPKKDRPANRTEVDFLVRQKEKPQGDGVYMGREWRFDNHNIVAEVPEGFQESHFDDLGTIEVLVLRCRAVNNEEKDYEGSSSGEDSDVFGGHPVREEGDEMKPPEDSKTSTTDGKNAVPAPVEDEQIGVFGLGLFDGANDYHEPYNRDGGHDGQDEGQWVWHQRQVPPEFHAPQNHHYQQAHPFPLSAAGPPPCFAPVYGHYDHSNTSIPSAKRVHWDYGPPGQPIDQASSAQRLREPSMWDRRPSVRPSSRERMRATERRPSNSSRRPTGPPYPPQNVNPSNSQQSGRHWQDARLPIYEEPNSRYRDGARPSWDNNNRNSSWYQDANRPRWGYGGGSSGPHDNRPASPRHQREPWQTSASYQRSPPPEPLPTLNQPVPAPPQYQFQHTLPEYTMPHIAAHQPSYPLHSVTMSGSTGYPSTLAPQPPQQWPMYYSGLPALYTHPYYAMHAASQVPGGPQLVPPPPPVMDEHISPKNTTFNAFPNQDSQNNPDGWGDTGNGQDTNNAGDSWNQDNGGNDDGWGNADDNGNQIDDNGQNDNNANWDGNNNDQQTDNNTGGDWENGGNDDNNGGDSWNDNSGNNGNDNTGWDNQPTNNNNANTSWDNQATNNGASTPQQDWNDGNQNGEPISSEVPEVPSFPKELYGPHGPYYAYRTLRPDDPKPDAEEEPRYDVPKMLAAERRSTKQVQPGPGYRYFKKRLVPEYIDSFDTPYARFVFKYRTKEQLVDEIGIEVDVEPSGDQEVRDLQDLDKQALIEMLLRAKGALGGRVPSPPLPPCMPASGSDTSLPVAIDAPKYNYLKYSLPPLRPSNFKHNSPSPAGSVAGSKGSNENKENDTGTQNTNITGEWQASNNDSWNAPRYNPRQSQQAGQSNSAQPRQDSATGSRGSKGGTWDIPDDVPPLPPAPDTGGQDSWANNDAGNGNVSADGMKW